jgi:serine/threonine protein kinase
VHRDVKPANVLLDHGQAKLADFGIATSIDRIATTTDGSIAGTAAYLAPEQARGEQVGPAADMYSLGLVLLEAMTGRREYPGPQAESALARLQRPPAVPDRIPADFAVLIRDLTRDQPHVRPTAAEAAATLAAGPTVPTSNAPATAINPSAIQWPRGSPPPSPGPTPYPVSSRPADKRSRPWRTPPAGLVPGRASPYPTAIVSTADMQGPVRAIPPPGEGDRGRRNTVPHGRNEWGTAMRNNGMPALRPAKTLCDHKAPC